LVIVLTGASSGIGFATAQKFTEGGHVVYGLSRTCAPGVPWEQVAADVTNPAALARAVQDILGRHGHIDVLVLCAGVGLASPADGDLAGGEAAAGGGEAAAGGAAAGGGLGLARELFDVNFFGVAEMVRLCLPSMKQARRGRIMIVSSMTGVFPLPYQSFYSASKGALCAYAAALTAEAQPFGVHVTALLPGGVRTPFTAKRRRMEELFGDARYPGYEKAVLAISREEQTGMSAEQVAAVIAGLTARKKPPAMKCVGGKYCFLAWAARFLPVRAVLRGVRWKYAGKSSR
jgi:NAD(P)-dependent dehydrogenase (short-subunit alcohol dehydrogenase family)